MKMFLKTNNAKIKTLKVITYQWKGDLKNNQFLFNRQRYNWIRGCYQRNVYLTDISLLMRFYKSLFQGGNSYRVRSLDFWRALTQYLASARATFVVRSRDFWRALTQYLACAHAIFSVRSRDFWHVPFLACTHTVFCVRSST